MDFGVHVLQAGHLANRDANLEFAKHAEALGFHSLFVGEHIVIPYSFQSKYPGSLTGEFPFPPELAFLEALTLLGFIAAATERIRLGTSVLAIPMRNPVITAKMLATIDVLSGGRLLCGVGTGWLTEEFEALNVPHDRRGDRLDEYVEVIRRCWTEDRPGFQGKYFKLADVAFYPKPLQSNVPIWIGGWNERAFRRAAQYGATWHASGTPESLAEGFRRVRALASECGRDPNEISLSLLAEDAFTRGEPERMVDDLGQFEAAGVTHALITFSGRNIEIVKERMSEFVNRVAAKM